ncbi:MAG: DUF3857 domain-containing protein [Fibrobacterota bacterium]|nr:DUF3857 domain-containing protein [Fibrobacterota bacterium]QQS06477.1 MAG: DUF3857 domain-containing protein [Fibrobacterota bacterium]
MLRFLLGLACLLASALPAVAAAPWSIGPVSGWVDLQDPPGPSEDLESEGGYRALFHDEQVYEGVSRHARFSRRVFLLESVEGARIFDGFSTDFDPSWQRVTLHWARILRSGKVLDRMDPAKIRLLSREDRLEEGQIDGWRTIHLVLEDLRPGDVLDYAWTIEGTHPALPQVASGSFHLRLAWVAERLRSRLVWDRPDSLRLKTFYDAPDPVEVRSGSRRILTWDLQGTEAADEPDRTPAWWTNTPSIDWTNQSGWEDISRLQLGFYAPVDRPEPAVVQLAGRLKERYPDDASRIAGTLRYLQDSIRYLGYEGGIGSHVPRTAGTTLKSRQGDCKDKTLLMTALLRKMGIEAHPTLVLTSGDRTLIDRLASPWFFNHVVVSVRQGGYSYVLDPTDRDQRGGLVDIPPPYSRWSLVLEPDSKGLTAIRRTDSNKPSYDLSESWDASAGPHKSAKLNRVVVRRGRVAEGMRERLSRSNLQKEIDDELDLLRKSWPGLRRVADPEMSEDSLSGDIRWTSTFECDSFWTAYSAGRVWKFTVGSQLIEDAAVDPVDTAGRLAPLAVEFPANFRVRVGVKLPPYSWDRDIDSTVVDVGPLSYRFRQEMKPDTFGLEWAWKTSDDHVSAEEIGTWASRMDSIQSETDWTITMDQRSWISKVNWPVSLLALLVLAAATVGACLAWRWNPPVQASSGPGDSSGWWVLYVLGALASPVVHVYNLWQGRWMFDPYQWNSQFDQAPEASLLVLVSMATEVVWLPATLLLLALYFRRRTSFPALNAILLTGMLSVDVTGAVLSALAGSENAMGILGQAVGRMPAVLLWVAYFVVAERSKAVFKETLPRLDSH